MKSFIFVSIIFTCVNLFSQKIQTYTGELDNGKVTYSYYIDTLSNEEIRHGLFKYSEKEVVQGSSYIYTITGNYKHDLKNGVWTYLITQIDNPVGDVFQTGTCTVKMSYKDGMPNGEWSYKTNFKLRQKLYTFTSWTWSQYEPVDPETIIVNFKNGVLTGKFYLKTSLDKITGQFDNEGRFIGVWKINSNIEMIVDTGYVVKHKISNIYGDISSQSNYDPVILDLIKQNKQISLDEFYNFCSSNNISVDTVPGYEYFNINDGYFDNSILKNREIYGDLTFVSDEYGNFYDLKNYGFVIFIRKKKEN
jgi:hypothetical protein